MFYFILFFLSFFILIVNFNSYDVLQGHSKAVLACVHYEPLDILITASVDKTICM